MVKRPSGERKFFQPPAWIGDWLLGGVGTGSWDWALLVVTTLKILAAERTLGVKNPKACRTDREEKFIINVARRIALSLDRRCDLMRDLFQLLLF